MENLKHTLNLPLNNEWHTYISDKIFTGQHGIKHDFTSFMQITDVLNATFHHDLPSQPFAESQQGPRWRWVVESCAVEERQALQLWMVQHDVHRVRFEMLEGMIHQNVKSHAQVSGRSDGRVNIPERGQPANLLLALFK